MRQKLGEREIIKIIENCLDKQPGMPVPFGDDVSGYDVGNRKLAVLKTDMLVDRTDMPPNMTLWQAARKAVVMNVSDFAAKGVKPEVVLVSLGLPAKLSEKDIEQIGKGLNAGAREYDTYIIGGDTNEASDIVISISVFGVAKKDRIMLRSGAGPRDLVAVTGSFGRTSSGLKILLDGCEAPAELRETLVQSVFMPNARLQEGLALSHTRAVTACIDSSDGLAWSLHEISQASNVGCLIDSIPIAEETERFAEINNLDANELALYGGEEYELVMTIKPEQWKHAEVAVQNAGGKLLPIGKVTHQNQILLESDAKRVQIKRVGWEHFRTSRKN
ncbi:MAG: thiamine-phosphate kinase [Candidatus Bathyarchaeota archaeon]